MMKQFRKVRFEPWITLVVFLLTGLYSRGQDETLSSLRSSLEKYNHQVLQEKLYVHTDKSFYLAGEVMWFKIYDVDGSDHKPLGMSKVAYLELLGADQKPVLQAKIAMNRGSGKGSFFLPLSMTSGYYTVRAYTSWMKNFSADYFFHSTISIVNTMKKLPPPEDLAGETYDIHFFPEGGNLVNGVQSKVGFRVVNHHGTGVECSGRIIDQDNQSVAEFSSLVFGMGHFIFTPSSGHVYKALVSIGHSNVIVVDLPKAYDTGYVMRVEDDPGGRLMVSVSASPGHADEPVYLLVHTGKTILSAAAAQTGERKTVFPIQKDKLSEGISQITLFNKDRQPVCERLYFKRPRPLTIDASLDRDQYALREKAGIDLQVDQDGSPSRADLSLSVYRLDSLEPGAQNSILSYLWLSADLTGEVESPEYYFLHTDAKANEAADNLMLTQGWRRFRWEDVLKNRIPTLDFVPEVEGHVITGRISNKKSGLPVENVMAYLSAPGYHFELGTSVSNKGGLVSFDINHFYGKNEVVLLTDSRKDNAYRLDILSPFSEKVITRIPAAFRPSEELRQDLESRSLSMQVQNAYSGDSLQKFSFPRSNDSTVFYGEPDKKYFLDEYTRFTTMEEVMREYVTGILVHKRQDRFYFRMLNDPYRQFFDDDPLVLIDGVPVFDADKIIAMDPLKVKKVELVNRKYFLGSLEASGILSYSTYNGDLEGFQLDPGALVLEYDGLQIQREFYSPVYETPAQKSSRVPDYRNLLYWSGDIRPDAQGKEHISFYTSDRPGKYLILVQGINDQGRSGCLRKTFEVVR